MSVKRFYKDASGLSRIVANFISEGLGASQPGLVIATPAHASLIKMELQLYRATSSRSKPTAAFSSLTRTGRPYVVTATGQNTRVN